MNKKKANAMSELSQLTNGPRSSTVKNNKYTKPDKKSIINIFTCFAVLALLVSTVIVVLSTKNDNKKDISNTKQIIADYAIGIDGNLKPIDVKTELTNTNSDKHKVSLVFYDKEDVCCFTEDKTLGNLINELGISLSENEQVKYDLDKQINEDSVFNIDNVSYGTATSTENIDFETEYVDSEAIPFGQTQVIQDGVYGIKTIEYTVTYVNGNEVSREKSGEYISQYPSNCIVYKGIGGSVNVNGTYYSYSHVLDCDSTVYTVYYGKGGTASGLPADENVIAVDPNVIPLGTRVYIEGIGIRIAADTGTAIIGNIIDIYFDYDNPMFANYGRRPVKVYVLN